MAVRVISPARPRELSVDDRIRHPDADQFELVDGLLRKRMVNQNQHEFTVVRVAYVLSDHLLRSGINGKVFGSNAKYRVRARRGIMPDVSVVLGEHADAIDPKAALNTVGPDLAVEVLSPEQGADYLEERLDDYWRLGTAEVWIVDPEAETVSGDNRDARDFVIFSQVKGSDEFSSQLLPGLRFSVSLLWQPH